MVLDDTKSRSKCRRPERQQGNDLLKNSKISIEENQLFKTYLESSPIKQPPASKLWKYIQNTKTTIYSCLR